ncbi:hypothetical protein ABE79_01365 [Proteus mirabilis]|nr:hypothetical protein ABE79_01365 [Proteus mirabilis]
MTLNQDSRIFQHKTVPQILQQLLDEAPYQNMTTSSINPNCIKLAAISRKSANPLMPSGVV